MRIRSLEDAFIMNNYLENLPKSDKCEKMSITQKIQNTFQKKQNID
jgi:hypothetical protein